MNQCLTWWQTRFSLFAISGLFCCGASAAALLLYAATPLEAQVVIGPPTPQIGSPQPATANPTVPRPETKPCVVSLFQNLEFADYNSKTYSYTPPSACPGPWAKVVFTADFTVTEGRQFDRTASFYLGHANIYYGTTAEPSATVSPSWHVERDVTDLSAIFKTAESGEAILGNFVGVSNGVTYNGLIYANAALEFYPASPFTPAPAAPNVVVPMPDAEGGAATLNTTLGQLAQTVTLPKNVEKVYLDVIAQSQSGDEFWYTCVPNDVSSELESCGNTPFRETEISIDGQAAGVAPVYPWIYSGGIDPYLWRPTPGVQTYNFSPYRVDLTPFAGLLSDGSQHTVAVSVYNANGYFLATANLLVYTDPASKAVTGGILSNNLSAMPEPQVVENLKTDKSGNVTGTVTVTSKRNYTIMGYLNTSHGKIVTTVSQQIEFSNKQTFDITASVYTQNIAQSTTTNSESAYQNGIVIEGVLKQFSYPLMVDITELINSDGSGSQTTTVQQGDQVGRSENLDLFPIYTSSLSNEVKSTDTLYFNSSGVVTGNTKQSSSQTFSEKNSTGYCYERAISSSSGLLTAVTDGQGCPRY